MLAPCPFFDDRTRSSLLRSTKAGGLGAKMPLLYAAMRFFNSRTLDSHESSCCVQVHARPACVSASSIAASWLYRTCFGRDSDRAQQRADIFKVELGCKIASHCCHCTASLCLERRSLRFQQRACRGRGLRPSVDGRATRLQKKS